MTEPLHKLGEVLRTAREAKGVDLVRIERETKIRTRYLTALEHGEYAELPGAVYTKGFLRNYGTFLGLDPEYLVDLYRLETAGNGAAERPSPAPPRPMNVRRARAFVVTPGAIAAAVLTVAVVAFVSYLVYEFVTFARTPDLQITSPVGDVSTDQLSFTITGTTEPNATVTVDGPRVSQDAVADAQGQFSVKVQLVPGSNVFTIVATDKVTQRDSAQQTRTIDVNLSSGSPTPGVTIALTGPQAGATVTGALTVTGTAPAGMVLHVEAALGTAAAPGFTITTFSGQPVRVPALAAGTVVDVDATAGSDGTFKAVLQLAPGTWQLSALPGAAAPTGSPGSHRDRSGIRIVGPGDRQAQRRPGGHTAHCRRPFVPPRAAGQRAAGWRLRALSSPPGSRSRLTAKQTLVVRAGNAGAVTMIINGVTIGTMGGSGAVIEWHIQAAR